jgi:LPS export ABC transporter protein LptC
VIAIVLGACSSGKQPPLATHNALADSADQVLFHTKSVLTDGGVMKAEVYGDTAYVFDDNTRVEMRTVRTIFFTATGARNAVLTSHQGTYNTRSNNMEARGDVVVVSEDGRHLTTPVLRYAQGRNEISSDSAFTLTDPTRQMTGIGFVSDPNMNNMRCFKACSGYAGSVTLPSGGDTTRGAQANPSAPPSAGLSTAVPRPGAPAPGAGAVRPQSGTPKPPTTGRATGTVPGGTPPAGATTRSAPPAASSSKTPVKPGRPTP